MNNDDYEEHIDNEETEDLQNETLEVGQDLPRVVFEDEENENRPARAKDYHLEKPKQSRNDLHVYVYNREINRYEPYKMERVRRNENFPMASLNKLLDDFEEVNPPPRMDRILSILTVVGVLTGLYLLVMLILDVIIGQKWLKVLLSFIALAPCIITSIMMMVFCAGYWQVIGRRDSLNQIVALRNEQSFHPLGISVVFSANCEWFCIEISNKKISGEPEYRIGSNNREGKVETNLMDGIDEDDIEF